MNGIQAGYIDIGIRIDTRQLQREIEQAKRIIASNQLEPRAALNNMHEFNRVMASKKADWRDLNREIDNNPLTPKFDDTELKELSKQVATVRAELKKEIRGTVAINTVQLDNAIAKVKTLNAEVASVRQTASVNANIRTSVQHSVDGTQAAKAIKDSFAESKDIIKDAIKSGFSSARNGSLLGLPFRAVGSFGASLFQGVGIAAGNRVAQGFGNATNSQLTQLGTFIDRKINDALKTGTIGLSRAAGYGSTREFRRDTSTFFDGLFDYNPRRVKKAFQQTEDRIVDVLESLIVDQDVARAKQQLKDFLFDATGGIRSAGVRTAGAAVRVGAQPFRVRKRVELARTIKEAESMVDEIINQMDDRLKAEIKKAKGVTIATGGVDFNRGQNAYFSANLVRKLTPGNVTIPFVNSAGNDPNNPGSFYQMRSALGFGGKPMPIDRFLNDAVVTGQNPDASRMLAQVMAVRKLTDKPLTLTGSSGGAALVEEVIAAAERRAIAQVKGVGLTLPGFDLTRNASTRNYRTMVGTYDPISISAFGSRYNDGSKIFQKSLASSPLPFDANGFLSPGRATTHFPGLGMGHHLGAFLTDPNVQAQFTAFAGTGRIDPSYSQSRKSFNYLNQLYSESDAIPRTLGTILGDRKSLSQVQSGAYSFLDPLHLNYRRDNDFASMIQNFEKLSSAVTDADRPEYDRLVDWLHRFKKGLTEFYESTNKVIPNSLTSLANEGQEFFRYKSGVPQPVYSPGYSVLDQFKPLPQYQLPNYQVIDTYKPFPNAEWTPPQTAIEKIQEKIEPVLALREPVLETVDAVVKFAKATKEAHHNMVAIARGVEDVVMLGRSDQIKGGIRKRLTNWGIEYTPYRPVADGKDGAITRVGNVARGIYGGVQRAEDAFFDNNGIVPGWVLRLAKGTTQVAGGVGATALFAPEMLSTMLEAGATVGSIPGTALGNFLNSQILGALPDAVVSAGNALTSIPKLGPAIETIGQGGGAILPTLLGGATGATGAGLSAIFTGHGAYKTVQRTTDFLLPGSDPNQAAEQLTGKAFNLLGAGINKAANEFKPAQSVQAQIEGAGAQLGLPPASELEAQNKQLREILKTIANLEQASKTLQSSFGTSVSRVSSGRFDYFDAANVGRAILGSERELAKTRYVQDFLRDQGLDQQFSQVNKSQLEIGRFKSRAYKALESQLPQIQAAAKAGDDTAQGFINALIESIPEIEKLANTTGQKYIAALKEALGVRSPSWITALIAEDVVQGFLNKGEEGVDDLERLAKKMGLSFTDEMRAALLADVPDVKELIKEVQDRLNQGDIFGAHDVFKNLPPELRVGLQSTGPTLPTTQLLSDIRGTARTQASDQLKDLGIDLNNREIRSQAEQLGRTAVNATAEGIRKGKEQVDSAVQFVMDRPEIRTGGAGIGGFFGGIRQGLDDIQKRFPILQQFKGQLVEIGFAVGGLIGAYSLGDFFVNFARGSIEVANNIDVLESRLRSFGTGQDYQGFERLMSIADELGLQYKTLEQDYLRMSSTLSKTEFAGQAESVFKNLSKAVVGLQPGEVSRFFTAVTQVVEKGRLFREEFTGQFSDIPGVANTIKQAISGGDNAEFQRRLTDGSISSTEFIQKLTGYMELNGASMDNAATKTARFNNALTKLQAKSGEAIQPALFTLMDTAASTLGLLANNTELVSAGFIALGVAGVKPLVGLVGGVLIPKIKELLVANGALITQNGVLSISWKTLGASILGVTKVLGTYALIGASISFLGDAYKSLTQDSEALTEAIKRSERALKALGKTSEEVKNNSQFQIENGFFSENYWTGLSDRMVSFFNKLNAETNKFFGLDPDFNRQSTFGDIELQRQKDQLALLSQRAIDGVSGARTGSSEAVRNAREQIESLKGAISNLEQGDPVRAEALKTELENAESTLKSMERIMGQLTQSSGSTVNAFKSLEETLQGITREFERQNRLIREQASNSRIGINAGILSGTLTPQQAERLRDQVDIQEQIAQRNNLQNKLSQSRYNLALSVSYGLGAALTGGVTDDEIKKQQDEAQKEIDATQDAIVQANQSISDSQVSIQQKLEQQQVATIESTRQLTQSIEEYYRNLQQQQRDLDRQVEDFVTNTGEQILDIRRDIEQAQSDRALTSKLVTLRGALLKTSSDLVTGIIEQVISIIEAIHDRTRQRLQFEAQRQQINRQIRSLTEGPQALARTINEAVYGNQQSRDQLNTQFIQAQGQQMGLSPLQVQQALTKSGLVNPVKGIWNAPGGYDADSGLDLLVPEGTKAVAAASGRLVYAERGHSSWMHEDASASMPGFQPQQSILIELDKPFNYSGKLIRYMWYTHLQAIEDSIKNKGSDVGLPTRIEAGQILGEIGKANNVPHLHFGLLSDRRQRHEGDWLNHRQVRDILYGSGGGLNLAPNISPRQTQSSDVIPAEVISPLGADHLAGSSNRLNLSERDLANLALTSVTEASGPRNQMDVAMAIMARTIQRGKSATDVVFEPGQFEVNFGHSPVSNIQEAIRQSGGRGQDIQTLLNNLKNPDFVAESIRHLNGATDFRGRSLLGNKRSGDPDRGDAGANWFLQESMDPTRAAQLRSMFGGTGSASLSTAAVQTSLGLSSLNAPSVFPAQKVAAGAIAEYRKQLDEIDKLERDQRILNDYQIKSQQESLKRSIEDTIKQNEQFIEANSFKAGLKDLYQGIPDELIPAELRNAKDSGYVGQFQQMTQELEQAQRDVTDLIEAAKFLEKLPEYKLGEAGITPELLGQLQTSLELRKSAVDRQLEELQSAQNLREAYEQINREREIADKDNAAIQDVLGRQLDLQGQFAGQLADEGKIWEANAINRQRATQEIQNQLDLELRRIELLRQELTLGLDNGYTFEQLDQLQEYAQESAKASSESVKTQYQTIAGSILETSKQAVQATISGLRQLVTESKSVGDFFENLFTRILDTIADALFSIVAQIATNGLFDALKGVFGGKKSDGSGNLLNTLFSVGTTAAGLFGGGGAGFDFANTLAIPAGFTGFSTGTVLPGYGGGDRRPALLEDGEAVLRKEVVRELGIDLVKGWNEKGVTKAMRGFTPAPTINRGYQPTFSEPTEAPSTNQPLQVETQMINNVEYMTKAEGLRLAQEAANQGANSALSRLKNSVGTRKGLGF